jgi:hypothetical protein
MSKKCLNCETEISGNRNYCDDKCRWEYHNKNYTKNFTRLHETKLTNEQIAFLSEMKVVSDLMMKGFDVYKKITKECTGLLILNKHNYLQIEVKTGFIKNNKLKFGKLPKRHHDILAIYLPGEDKIYYSPELPIAGAWKGNG